MTGDRPLLRQRNAFPVPRTPPHGQAGLDGSGDPARHQRRFVDYKMEATRPGMENILKVNARSFMKSQAVAIHRNEERPANLIGKRIVDSIPFGSRL